MNNRHTQAVPENKASKADEPGGEHEHVFCCRVCGLEPASAPDRAEELARDRNWLKIAAQNIFYAYQCSRDAGADAVASLLREAEGRWIPASERLPEFNVDVLFMGDGWQLVAKLKEHVTEEDDLESVYPVEYAREFFTHWQPLPAPPREGG